MARYIGRSYQSLQEERRQRLERGSDDEEEEFIDYAGPHRHCYFCYSFTLCNMSKDPDLSCDFTTCSLGCGAVFHGCKQEEHLELCPNVVVPCLNVGYGCPREMQRKDQGVHLEKCPASVVICMAEWNRWPVYSSERKKHIPFRQSNPHAYEGQLDYDLAMRDQRMLRSLETIPRRTKVVLRNNLTRRFPAVPLPSSVAIQRQTDDKDEKGQKNGDTKSCSLYTEHDIDIGDNLTYIGVRKPSQLQLQMQAWQEDLDKRLKGKKIPPKYWEFPELEKGSIHGHCAYCFDINCDRTLNLGEDDEEACGLTECRFGCGAIFHVCKSSEHHMICSKYEESDMFEWMYNGMSLSDRKSGKAKEILQACQKKKKKLEKAKKPEPKKSIGDLFFGPGEPALKPMYHIVDKNLVPNAPEPVKTKDYLTTSVRLDLRLETETRVQTKPKSMYTFVCAQQFRRDEYQWHSKNVHDDILGGMNNWIEQRCPMASYGCGYSVRRMYPKSIHDTQDDDQTPKSTIVFSPDIESFGIAPKIAKKKLKPAMKKKITNLNSKKTATNSKLKEAIHLTDLPFEILYQIAEYLESFSICNLAVTCTYLRYVCCSLLDTRGCVTLQWERLQKDGKIFWDIAYKQWFFSSAMDPIRGWIFNAEIAKISEHLKICPYNVRTNHSTFCDHKKKDSKWENVMNSLISRLELKRKSEWFL